MASSTSSQRRAVSSILVPVFGADVQGEGAVIGGGEEVLAEERDEEHGQEAAAEEAGDEELAVVDDAIEGRFVAGANGLEDALKAALEAGEWVARERRVVVDGLEHV